MDDYFFLEPLIVQRLIEGLGSLVDGVYTARDLSSLMEGRVETPAVYVLFDREVVPGADGMRAGNAQVVDQYWQVVLAVRVYDSRAGGREEAGPLLAMINRWLMGWLPHPRCQPLRKVSAPGAHYDDSGLNLYSLTFVCRMVMTGQE